jgi:hypothetical protein
MALQKSITLANGATGNYIRVNAYRWDKGIREASALLALYTNATLAASAPGSPLVPIVAKLRLSGAKFDQYLGNAALDALPASTRDKVREQFYAAAKIEGVISDYGDPATVDGKYNGLRILFSDAVDV